MALDQRARAAIALQREQFGEESPRPDNRVAPAPVLHRHRDQPAAIWRQRADRYSELRGAGAADAPVRRVEMHYIGG